MKITSPMDTRKALRRCSTSVSVITRAVTQSSVNLIRVISSELKSKIDRLWDAFWSGGISNPLEVIEQITYLMFLRRLDHAQTAKEKKNQRTGTPIEGPLYTVDNQALHWAELKELSPDALYEVIDKGVFPALRRIAGDDSTYTHHMRDARFTIPNANLLAKAFDMIDDLPLGDGKVQGDLYEYMLSKIATAGHNGQFRTPRHIIQLIVAMMNPGPQDEICDPACGTAGFLVAASEHIRAEHNDSLLETSNQKHFHNSMFHGFDFDITMLRIASMNMLMHGVEQPDIRYRDSLVESVAEEAERYSLILANPPFAGSLDYESTARDLQQIIKTKKIELLFPLLSLSLLKPGGRAAVIVPGSVLFGSSKAHKCLRQLLVENQKLDAVVKLPSGTFKPYSGVSTAILFFTKTNSGGTDNVWFYDVTADGFSLDDRRTPLLPWDKLGALAQELDSTDHEKNNLPDVLARWARRDGSEQERDRTAQSFCIPKKEISSSNYTLSLEEYAKRPRYLIPGLRVALLDLFKEGLLKKQTKIILNHEKATHAARITDSGWIELNDGQKFEFIDQATAAATGDYFDSWSGWRLEDGTTLDQLRQKFLETPTRGIPKPKESGSITTKQRHELLKKTRDAAEKGQPEKLTAKALIDWWETKQRGYHVRDRIYAELANHSLTTFPAFDAVPSDTNIQIITKNKIEKSTSKKRKSETTDHPPSSERKDDLSGVGLTVGNLPSALSGVLSVSPSTGFDEAITHMVINDYSQLPVISGRELRGAVTWKSITRARHAYSEAKFSQAVIPAQEVSYNQDLIDILPILKESDFVLVRDQTRSISGIITASDMVAAYGDMATPFFLIGELDQRIRRTIVSHFDITQIRNLCDPDGDRDIKSFDELSIGDYQRVLENKDSWASLGWQLDRKIFIDRLNELRNIRNDLMHFNPDPISESAVRHIRHMITLLREYGA